MAQKKKTATAIEPTVEIVAKEAIERFLDEQPKATLRSMKKIVAQFDGIPTNIVSEESGMNFDIISGLLLIGVQQLEPTVTEDDIDTYIDMDNLTEALKCVSLFITMRVPEGIVPEEMVEPQTDEQKEEGVEELKNSP